MKVSEAITRADELRVNAISEKQKAAWLFNLDGEIAEFMEVKPPVNAWPNKDVELLMPAPHDDVYVFYLVAMIDYYNQESTMYVNDMDIYNRAMKDARAWWRRGHRPKSAGDWRVM